MIRFTVVRIHTATQSHDSNAKKNSVNFHAKCRCFFVDNTFLASIRKHTQPPRWWKSKSYENNSMKMCVFFLNSICKSQQWIVVSPPLFSQTDVVFAVASSKPSADVDTEKLFYFRLLHSPHYLVWPKRLWTLKCGTLFCVTINA